MLVDILARAKQVAEVVLVIREPGEGRMPRGILERVNCSPCPCGGGDMSPYPCPNRGKSAVDGDLLEVIRPAELLGILTKRSQSRPSSGGRPLETLYLLLGFSSQSQTPLQINSRKNSLESV